MVAVGKCLLALVIGLALTLGLYIYVMSPPNIPLTPAPPGRPHPTKVQPVPESPSTTAPGSTTAPVSTTAPAP